MQKKITKQDISVFSLSDVERYLKYKKWAEIDRTDKAIIFTGPKTDSGKAIIFKLPISENNFDYFDRISDLINIIAALERIGYQEIINQIAMNICDTLKIRIINPGKNNLIPLDVAATEIMALKSFFTYAATSEIEPRPFFDRPLARGIEYANNCQFGHTFEGSFGFKINSPIRRPDQLQIDLSDQENIVQIPFERKVMERIVSSFIDIKEACQKEDVDIIVDNFENGLNSRMCDSLIDISIEKTKNIEYSIEWNSEIKPSKKIGFFSNILLEKPELEVIEEASKILKSVDSSKELIIGQIVELHSNKYPFSDENFSRAAVIKHEFKGRKINVKLEVNKKEYEIAYKAHGTGRAIKVEGNLFKKGSTWRMVDIQVFDFFQH